MKFIWSNRTKLIFGAGEFAKLGIEAAAIGKHALIVTGKSSTKRSGVLDKAMDLLRAAGVSSTVFDEIEPNPRSKTVDRAAATLKEKGCDFVIGLGGGSPMDAAKSIAVVASSGGSIWDYIYSNPDKEMRDVTSVMPIVTVPTLAATGSEANGGSVITNWETNEKAPLIHPLMYPVFSIIDPELTASVPADYTGDGGIDIISHVMESYFSSPVHTPLQDRFSEGVIRTVMDHLGLAMANGNDIDARSHLSWASTVALSGIVNAGRLGGFPLHAMEHSISGHYDISHGRGLAILMPHLMRYTAEVAPDKYVQFAKNVFFVDTDSMSPEAAIDAGISKFTEWMKQTSVYFTLSDVGIGSEKFEVMADDIIRVSGYGKDYIDNARNLYKEDIIKIFEMAR
ncbi:MAG: iron-containing alcohol dehydrogenase [candidate division Zixibacteria bacterium]|nr:iron-containing alcohol dehydrogenase [candidate division Zixibacteria bacterium]MBU1470674.1 iron-containing alcohol dehydrogenase [candidate division Zixibacteria bacterium]MBU2626684.1 iron-containing alcohol dehydrogenase [candidate division Zixibacteria bacterium]